jgi:hypothetical protein
MSAITASVVVAVVGVVCILFAILEFRKPGHGHLPAACYTVAIVLTIATVYVAFNEPLQEHWIRFAVLACVTLGLYFIATRIGKAPFAISPSWVGFAILLAILVALFAGFNWLLRTTQFDRYCLAAAFFGALVGVSELISRYRDEPYVAVSSKYGLVYIAINSVISAFALGLLRRYSDKVFPSLKDDPLLMSCVAGFGAMVVMRSKLFTLKTPTGEEVAVGPDAAITNFLRSVDRAVDRSRSRKRQALIFEMTRNLAFDVRVSDFFKGHLVAYQNLTNDEKSEISKIIDDVKQRSDLDPQLKLMAISFGFLNISGEEGYRELMTHLKKFVESQQSKPDKVASPPSGSKVPNDSGKSSGTSSTTDAPTANGAPRREAKPRRQERLHPPPANVAAGTTSHKRGCRQVSIAPSGPWRLSLLYSVLAHFQNSTARRSVKFDRETDKFPVFFRDEFSEWEWPETTALRPSIRAKN